MFQYTSCELQPRKLTEEEINNPYLVIDNLFGNVSLPNIRLYLWHWLKVTITDGFHQRLDSKERDAIVFLYEQLEKLVEAVHLIRQPNTASTTKTSVVATLAANAATPLAAITTIICTSFYVEKIFLLEEYPAEAPATGVIYDLLVLIHESEKRALHEYESLVVNRCHSIGRVHASVYPLTHVNQLMANGNRFFIKNCTSEKLLYDDKQTPLATPPHVPIGIQRATAQNDFDAWLFKSYSFLNGAFYFKEQQNYSLAAFMLHQAVEHTYNAVLVSLLGLRMVTHNLNRLMQYSRRCTHELNKVFPRNNEAETELFELLQKAYIHARYKDHFTVPEATIQVLLERAATLQAVAKKAFDENMDIIFPQKH